jgi:hypothetical protein
MIMNTSTFLLLVVLSAASMATGFVVPPAQQTFSRGIVSTQQTERDDFEFSFEIPKKGIADVGTAEVRLPPVLEESELVVVRYDLPFGLDAAPDEKIGQVVVTKDGQNGEKVGDILRQTTYWRGKEPLTSLFRLSSQTI